MKIDLSLLPVDSQLSGFELGNITLTHEVAEFTSAGHQPSQSMMIFIFLSDLLDVVSEIRNNSRETTHRIIATDSSFSLSLRKIGKDIFIENQNIKMILPLEDFARTLYSSIREWLNPLKTRIDPTDSAMDDLLYALNKYQTSLEHPN